MRAFACAVALCLSACAVAGDDASPYSPDAFAACAACHLASGEGIPGAFPAIRGRATQIAALDGGRSYLVSVAAFGLMGPISAGGTAYSGIMPGHQGTMDADAIAAALNYLVFELTDEASEDTTEFSGEEVTSTVAGTENASPMTAAALRKTLAEQHGDAWPD